MSSERASWSMFGFLNMHPEDRFRSSNASRLREVPTSSEPAARAASNETSVFRRTQTIWRLPLAARVPIVSGALILAVAMAVSHVMMSIVAHEQELGVRRLAAVYLEIGR